MILKNLRIPRHNLSATMENDGFYTQDRHQSFQFSKSHILQAIDPSDFFLILNKLLKIIRRPMSEYLKEETVATWNQCAFLKIKSFENNLIPLCSV